MKRSYWIILIGIVLALAGYVGWDYLDRTPTASALADQALSDAPKEARVHAVAQLASLKDKNAAVPELRRVLKESKDHDVVYAALSPLAAMRDGESVPDIIPLLGSRSEDVRQAAYDFLKSVFSVRLPADFIYDVDGSPENHARAIRQLQKLQNEVKPPTAIPGSNP